MKTVVVFVLSLLLWLPLAAAEQSCFESRLLGSTVIVTENAQGQDNVKCSPTTGAVLWWRDPFENTQPMAARNVDIDDDNREGIDNSKMVIKSRVEQLALYQMCGIGCHNGKFPVLPENNAPRQLTMHVDLVPDPMNMAHGNGRIWCLECHHATKRRKLVDHFGNELHMNDSPSLCGSCHGQVLSDWRDGIHGKRIGEWASNGKKRWFTCTECHNPHDVQQGDRNSGFAALQPESAPVLPKGMTNTDHERAQAPLSESGQH